MSNNGLPIEMSGTSMGAGKPRWARVLISLLWLGVGMTAGGGISAGIAHLATALTNTKGYENQPGPAWQPGPAVRGMIAWQHGRWQGAEAAWIERAEQGKGQDLQAAGWALRAADKAGGSPARAVGAWNEVRSKLPEGIRNRTPKAPEGVRGKALWKAMHSQKSGQFNGEGTYQTWLAGMPDASEDRTTNLRCATASGCQVDASLGIQARLKMGQARVSKWKQEGLSPQEAGDLYAFQRLVGLPGYNVKGQGRGKVPALQIMRDKLQMGLAQVDSPGSLKKWIREWPTVAKGSGVKKSDWDLGDETFLGGLAGQSWKWPDQPGAPTPPVSNQAKSWEDLEWEVAADLAGLPAGGVRCVGVGGKKAERMVQEAVRTAGLAEVSWPVAWPDGAETRCKVAELVAGANQWLQQQSGWQGPVLGLGGRVAWRLEARPGRPDQGKAVNVGITVRVGGWTRIATAVEAGDAGPVAHEWVHGLDNLVGKSLWGQSGNGSSWATTRVAKWWPVGWRQGWVPGAQTRAWREAWIALLTRVAQTRGWRASQIQAFEARWDEEPYARSWAAEATQQIAKGGRPGCQVVIGQGEEREEECLVTGGMGRTSTTLSVADVVESEMALREGGGGVGQDWRQYVNGGSERLARSFEARAFGTPWAAHTDNGMGVFSYAQGPALAAQAKAWQQALEILQPWWEQEQKRK